MQFFFFFFPLYGHLMRIYVFNSCRHISQYTFPHVSINCLIICAAFCAHVLSYNSFIPASDLGLQFPSHTDFHGISYSSVVIYNYLFHILVKLGCYVKCTVAEQYQIGRQQIQRRGSYRVNGRMCGVCGQLAGEGGRAVVRRSTNMKLV